MMKLIVGLGNPGRKYEKNRHNLGYMCLRYFARQQGIKFNKRQAGARTGAGEISGFQVILARPQTYMNESGLAVRRLVDRFKVDIEDLLVIHDDLDLPTGKIRLRRGGSSGGHKGIDSVAIELGSREFIRVRIGIGRPVNTAEISEADIIKYVLGDFDPDEKKVINKSIPVVSEAIMCILDEGLTIAMNKYN